jgi:hypothetical protein
VRFKGRGKYDNKGIGKVRRYQRGNQKMQIEELQTIQWPKDTKKIIRSCKSKNYRQYNGQKKQDKMTSNDLQNTTQKTKNLATRTQLKNRGKLRCIQFYCSALNIFNKNRQVQL